MFNFSALRSASKSANRTIFSATKTYGRLRSMPIINGTILSNMGRGSAGLLGKSKNIAIGTVNKIGKVLRGV